MELKGMAAFVAGGASGLGEATARELAARGVCVTIADLNEERGAALAEEIGGTFAKADVTDEAQVQAAVESAGELRLAVSCAGIGWAERTVKKDGPAALGPFETVVRVNLIGTFNILRLAAAAMAGNEPDAGGERGAVVMTASIAAFDGQIGQAAYSASKGGVVGMTLPVARDLSAAGIRLNTVAPGLIDTPIYGEGEESEAFKAKLGESVLFPKRLGEPDELASMVLECVRNSYMNAETVRVDGGIRMPPK
jgi:NAD(P)-dependent dehydrogenase (short-subunit alcohol dehydrogenase family)